MLNSSKAKVIADLLMSDESRWWSWDEIMEGLMPGFTSMVPANMQIEIIRTYQTYMPHVLVELDARGKYRVWDGRGVNAKFKIATQSPNDRPDVERCVRAEKNRARGISNRVATRLGKLKDEKILPSSWSPAQIE